MKCLVHWNNDGGGTSTFSGRKRLHTINVVLSIILPPPENFLNGFAKILKSYQMIPSRIGPTPHRAYSVARLRQLPCRNYRRSVWILSKFAAAVLEDEWSYSEESRRRNSPQKGGCWASGEILCGTDGASHCYRKGFDINMQIGWKPIESPWMLNQARTEESRCWVPRRNRRPVVFRIPLTSFDKILWLNREARRWYCLCRRRRLSFVPPNGFD